MNDPSEYGALHDGDVLATCETPYVVIGASVGTDNASTFSGRPLGSGDGTAVGATGTSAPAGPVTRKPVAGHGSTISKMRIPTFVGTPVAPLAGENMIGSPGGTIVEHGAGVCAGEPPQAEIVKERPIRSPIPRNRP